MKMRLLVGWLLLTLGAGVAFAAEKGSSDDPVMRALKEEMQRSKEQLKLESVASPYYIDYRVFELDDIEAHSSFGAIELNTHSHVRFARVVVRVGDFRQDSFFTKGEGIVHLIPLGDDIIAMRHELWLATDQAYKVAAETLSAKQAQLKQFTVEQPVDDFAHADPVEYIGPLAQLEGDPAPWIESVRQASSLYKDDLQLENCDAFLHFQAVNRYFVTSEGTAIRSGQTFYQTRIGATTHASDGMRVIEAKSFTGTALSELPSNQQFQSEASGLITSLRKLRDAPVVSDEYTGPILMSANAAAKVFANLVGENILGLKPPPGQPARTKGAFATAYKSRVLPEFLSVVDDPTLSAIAGQPLLGYYRYDDEGVQAQKVNVIERGKLVSYVIGRTPIRDFPASNGHGRARIPGNPPGASLGNLIVTASDTMPSADLKSKLLELCRQRDLPYCYYVATIDPQNMPQFLYRVWVKDGHEELVRGAEFGDLDTRALRNNLIAAGSDRFIENRLLNIPHSIVSPAILFDELQIKPANKNRDKLPEYPPPPPAPAK